MIKTFDMYIRILNTKYKMIRVHKQGVEHNFVPNTRNEYFYRNI